MGGLVYKGRDNKQVKNNVKIAICCDVMPCGKGKVHPCTGTEALYRPYSL